MGYATDGSRQGALAGVPPPNVIFIMMDDLGYGDLGSYGSETILTPNLDALALEGKRFTNYYTNSSVCSPTRVSLLTGQYPSAFGFLEALQPPRSTIRGIPDVLTLPEILGGQGYSTVHVGKWHLGDIRSQYFPISRGFDHSVEFVSALTGDDANYFDPPITLDSSEVIPERGHLTDILTDYSIEYIDGFKSRQPFFLNLWHFAPHRPLEPPQRWADQYPDTDEGRYAALVSHTDEQIGRMLDALDDFGLAENTLVIVTSDNGGTEQWHTSNGELRGFKSELYEGGIKVPMIARWPGVIVPGSTEDSVIVGFDLVPTLAELAGFDISGLGLPGESFASALIDDTPKTRSSSLFWDTEHFSAIRRGDFKLVQRTFPESSIELFDLSAEPSEMTNLSPENPELTDDLIAEWIDWRVDISRIEPPAAGMQGDVFVHGREITFGVGGMITLEKDNLLDFYDGEFTFAANITPTAIGTEQIIATKEGSWKLFLTPDGRLALDVFGEGRGVSISSLRSSTILVTGQSNDIAFTVSGQVRGQSQIHLYVDGLVEDVTSEIEFVSTNSNQIRIGNDTGLGRQFLGNMANLGMFVVALHSGELAVAQQTALPAAGSYVGGLP